MAESKREDLISQGSSASGWRGGRLGNWLVEGQVIQAEAVQIVVGGMGAELTLAVFSTLAWSVLPRTMLDDQVVRLPLPGIQLQRRLGYILHRERTLSNAARAFMALLDSHAGSA